MRLIGKILYLQFSIFIFKFNYLFFKSVSYFSRNLKELETESWFILFILRKSKSTKEDNLGSIKPDLILGKQVF